MRGVAEKVVRQQVENLHSLLFSHSSEDEVTIPILIFITVIINITFISTIFIHMGWWDATSALFPVE